MTLSSLAATRLGRTDMVITRVGFGAWAIGGDWIYGWGSQDDHDAVAAIRHAVERGVNWIDTAAVYGLGHSEEVVARALKGMSVAERPYVFSKGGLVWDDDHRDAAPKRVGAPDSLRREVEASLRRLDVEQIDLYQLHWPPEDGTPLEDCWQTLIDLKAEGKVRAVGLSNHDGQQLARAEALGHVDSLQPPFSAIRRGAAADLLQWCQARDTGVIVYSPMQSGLLSGAFNAERVANLPDNDWRKKHPNFTTRLSANLAVADVLAKVAARHGVSQPAAAVAWTLGFGGVSGAIVGARSPRQVDGWLSAAEVVLDEQDYGNVAEVIARHGAGEGPMQP